MAVTPLTIKPLFVVFFPIFAIVFLLAWMVITDDDRAYFVKLLEMFAEKQNGLTFKSSFEVR